MLRDVMILTFDLLTLMGHMVNPSTKIEDLTAIPSWVMSSDISHRIPLTLRLQPLRMRRITWPMRRRQIFYTYLKSLTPVCDMPIHNTTCMALWCGPVIMTSY